MLVVNFMPWSLYPRGKTTIPIEEEVGTVPYVTRTFWKREKNLSHIRN
jgi:hypothetical protein